MSIKVHAGAVAKDLKKYKGRMEQGILFTITSAAFGLRRNKTNEGKRTKHCALVTPVTLRFILHRIRSQHAWVDTGGSAYVISPSGAPANVGWQEFSAAAISTEIATSLSGMTMTWLKLRTMRLRRFGHGAAGTGTPRRRRRRRYLHPHPCSDHLWDAEAYRCARMPWVCQQGPNLVLFACDARRSHWSAEKHAVRQSEQLLSVFILCGKIATVSESSNKSP